MYKTYKVKVHTRPRRDVGQIIAVAMLLLLLALVFEARAQEGSQGNTTIFGGAQMTFFANHDFATPAGGTQPGVILTERETATMSYLNYFGDNLTATGVTDASYVDGYVRKYGAGQFVFPTGDNGNAGQFAASADGTSGAYFHGDPSTAITSNLFTGSAYPTALPAGGPFATTSKATTLGAVSNIEYWDIDGATATKISLTWDAASAISTLTGGDASKLTIVGWNPTLSQWVKIPSTLDATSVLGTPSNINTTGSITTNANIVPNTYTAYTFGSLVPDLTPTSEFDDLNFTAGQTRDFNINIFEILNVATNSSTVSFRLTRLTGWDITVPGLTLTATDQSGVAGSSNVNGGTVHENDRWLFKQNSGFITITLKPGNIITGGGLATLGFVATRKAGTITGTTQNITATITGGSGGEVDITNNRVITNISAN